MAAPRLRGERRRPRCVAGRVRQGDLERLNRLPQSPNMNREVHNQPQISLGFIDYVVKPFIEALKRYIPAVDVLLEKVTENRAVRAWSAWGRGGPSR